MEGLVELGRLGGSFPRRSRRSRAPATLPGGRSKPPAGMLNSIGLDNDGIEAFVAHHLPYLAGLGVPIVVSIAGHDLRRVRRHGRAA